MLHISTADELALFERGPLVDADGKVRKKITAETCIHFLRFDRGDYAAGQPDQVQPGNQGSRRPRA